MRVKRIYDVVSADDGYRVLVDGIWPRGVRKEDLRLDLWLKQVAPSHELRRWFGHDPRRWDDFRERYRTELDERSEAIDLLLQYYRQGPLTLLYSARDTEHNQAVVLREYLLERASGPSVAR